MVELFAKSGNPNQMPHSAASDLGLQCLPITLLGVSRLQWVKALVTAEAENILKYVSFIFLGMQYLMMYLGHKLYDFYCML